MSMFHELMMRKKEETLYPVIKGTLTESPEGVFSGFSNSNYLQINNALPTTVGNKYVFEGEVSLSSITSYTQYVFTFKCNKSTNAVFGFAFLSSGKFILATTNGTSTTVNEGTSTYQSNTNYKYKIETDLNTYARLYINDNLEISLALSYTNIKPYDGTICYGSYIDGYNLSLTTGTMNLNKSSIKINSTKYNLQAVVGYTVVGSPTITDGVASGFNAYPNTPAYIYINKVTSSLDSLELNLDFTTSAIVSSAQALLSHINSSAKGFLITFTSTRTVRICVYGVSDESSSTNKDFVANTSYILKMLFKNNNLIVQIFEKQTNEKIFEYTKTSITLENLSFAYGVSIADIAYTKFQGSIDLNNTYIKINNKLWFNGQQA